MIISDLLGSRVFGQDFLGFVSDVRFMLEPGSVSQQAQFYGIIVSPHARSSSLGFERSGVRSPWPIAALVPGGIAAPFSFDGGTLSGSIETEFSSGRDFSEVHRNFLDHHEARSSLPLHTRALRCLQLQRSPSN